MNNLSQEQNLSLIEKAKSYELSFLNNFKNETPWVNEFKNHEINLCVYSLKVPNKTIKKFKATSFVKNVSPKQFIDYIEDVNKRIIYDKNLKSIKKFFLEKNDNCDTFILQTETNQVGPVSSREFIDLSIKKNLENGNIIFCGSGLDTNNIFPFKQNIVRGINYGVSGWFIEKNTSQDGVHLTLISETDLKGWFHPVVSNNAICYGLIGIFTGIHEEFKLNTN